MTPDPFDALEEALIALEAAARSNDGDRGRELIRLRRELSDRMADVRRFADAPGSPFAAVAEEFQQHFSHMRSAVAQHQADWSAVRVDTAVEAYRKSSRAASRAIRDFLAWARTTARA